jgi:hypothetical protein
MEDLEGYLQVIPSYGNQFLASLLSLEKNQILVFLELR